MEDRNTTDQATGREPYEAPRLAEIGTLLELTAADQYSFVGGGADFAIVSSVTA